MPMPMMADVVTKGPHDDEKRCPACGRRCPGRPRVEVPVQNIIDALKRGATVAHVAQQHGVSRATVYRVLNGKKVEAQE